MGDTGGGIVGAAVPDGATRGGIGLGGKPGEDEMTEGSMEVTLEELQEFLEADRSEVHARPEFKERLRDKLWEVVRQRRRFWRGGGS